MRLLRLDGAGEVSFTDDLPEADLPNYSYAILSHRWGPTRDEVSYEDILNDAGKAKSKPGYGKIRFCVEQSQRDGLKYFWLDTCCINKDNEHELQFSLGLMFRWYQMARKCYVYLSDVYKVDEGREMDWTHALRRSVWFKRYWTLQELIAPPIVEFFSKCGTFIGSKRSLEKEINAITGIPIDALRGKPLAEFTVQERLLWQEGRESQQPEDMVYSLLGILGVSMPILYGEGTAAALVRVEAEITVASRGSQHRDFSLTFSLAEAPVETENFVARARELSDMQQHLGGDGSRQVVLHGLGGMGKTQLAMAYAKRYKDDYSSMLWLNAKDEAAIKSSFSKVAKRILRDHPEAAGLAALDVERDVEAVASAIKAWPSTPLNSRWLLICDNFDNPKVPGNANRQSTMTFAEYLHHFNDSWLKPQERSPALMTYENDGPYSTWQISYDQIKQRNPVSANLLRLWAYFHNQDLWFELLDYLTQQDEKLMRQLGQDRLVFEDCMQVICGHGLAALNMENAYGIESAGYRVHTGSR